MTWPVIWALSIIIIYWCPAARSDCSSPTGIAGQFQYISPNYKVCDGNVWASANVSVLGTTCPGQAGKIFYTGSDLQYCNNTNWVSMDGSQSSGACGGITPGTFRYNSTTYSGEWCNGTNWKTTRTATNTIAWVQKVSYFNTGTGTSKQTASFGSATTSGNLIVCWTNYNSGTNSVSTVTDTAGNSYTRAGTVNRAAGAIAGISNEIWYKENIVGGSNVKVTIAVSGSGWGAGGIQISCNEYSGVATSNALDQTAYSNATSVTLATVGPVSTTSAKELIFVAGFFTNDSNVGAGFTMRDNGWNNMVEDKFVTTAGSVSGTAIPVTSPNDSCFNMATFRSQ